MPVILATLLVIPAVVIEATASSPALRSSASVLNWVIWLVFVAEIVLLLTVAEDRRRWLGGHPFELALVVLTVPFLPASMQAARLLRLARLIRLVFVVRLARQLFSPSGVGFAAFVSALAVLAGGAAFQAAETAPGRSPSMWDGIWWAVTTLTTVGYGDLHPETVLGRIVGIALMVVGIGFVALLTGAIATRFISVLHEPEPDARGPAQADSDELTIEEEFRELAERLARLEARITR